MLRLLALHLFPLGSCFAAEYPAGLIVDTPAPYTIASPILKYSARAQPGSPIRRVEVVGGERSLLIFVGEALGISGPIDLSQFDSELITLRIEVEQPGGPNVTEIPILVLSNPRYSAKISARGAILDLNEHGMLYRGVNGAYITHNDGRPENWLPLTPAEPDARNSLLTPGGAVVLNGTVGPSLYELSNGLTRTHPGARGVMVRGNFGLIHFVIGSMLRNFVTDTNISISREIASADLAEDGTVYLSVWNGSQSNTTLYKFAAGEMTQLVPETNQVQGRVQTDGVNMMWFSTEDAVGTNGFDIHLLTSTGRELLVDNYVPIMRSWIDEPTLAMMSSGWTIFPKADAQGVHHVWRRAPDGMITQATSFNHSTVPTAMGTNGAFVAMVLERQPVTKNELYFVAPGAEPVRLGRHFGATYRFLGSELIAVMGNLALKVNVEGRPIRLTAPQFDPFRGYFSCYVTATEAATFSLQHSLDTRNWENISTSLTATTEPRQFHVLAAPGFFRARRE